MSAKEMFKDLGYEREYDYLGGVKCESIMYKKENFMIRFCMTELGDDLQIISDNKQVDLNIDEFKAIQKQIEELGWESDK